jgi:nucleoside-diphosphate-sugar epimerase
MKVAVTGATGCLGRPLVEKLVERGVGVKALARLSDPTVADLERRLEVVIGSVKSDEALQVLTKDCEIVFHLAGKVHVVPKDEKEEQEVYEVNVDGTKSVLAAAARNKVKRVVFYSTVGVYGKDADFHGDELSPCMPESVYAKTKYEAERLVLNSGRNGGPAGVVLRFPVVYGAFDRGNVANLIKTIYKKRFFYFGDGKVLRSMISSKNTAAASFKAAFEPGSANRVFCITDGKDYRVVELVECICHALNLDWRPFHIPHAIAEGIGKVGDFVERVGRIPFPVTSDRVRKLSRPLTFSCEKAKRELGYEPKESLAEGISKEVEWLRRINGWK